MNRARRFVLSASLLNVLWATHFLDSTASYTPYGAVKLPYDVPWLPYTKPDYPTYPSHPARPSWYPLAEPYGYGPAVHQTYPPASPTSVVPQGFQEHPSGFSQQQIVHIHDSGPPDVPNGDNYYEGHDYNIHNIISNVGPPEDDLEGVASSKVEVHKQTPKAKAKPKATSRPTKPSKRSTSRKPQKRKPMNKATRNQSPKRRRSRPQTESRAKRRPNAPIRKNPRRRSSQPVSYRRQQVQRQQPQRRKTRPTRRTHSRNPNYDYGDYNRFSGETPRRKTEYQDIDAYHDYRASGEEQFARQDNGYDYDYDGDNDDSYEEEADVEGDYEADVEPSSTEAVTESTTETALTTTAATATPETTTTEATTTKGVTMSATTTTANATGEYDFDGYGPSNGHENISITYAPATEIRQEYDTPNFWYLHQGTPDIFHYKNYVASNNFFK